ncbi:MAG TPA: CDP-diacylglycerol--glycerol-3-phosphate 3-phosphatidyltransferase [Thermoleophilia bacterium]|nr:CDP-diacylglycerol--glycerol-3-phosphate 3-phosphatidyltransferase [Thermoleophilia bacterium]
MNAANAITIARILLVPVFVVLLFVNVPYGEFVAIAVFSIAAATDKLDGYLARSRNSITVLGQFLDPLADKLLISAALISLVALDRLPAWVAMVIIAREMAVTGLRIAAIAQGVSIPADTLGKWKTTAQIAMVILLLLPQVSQQPGRSVIEDVLMYVAVVLTVVSGVQYFVNARDRLHIPWSEPR